MVVSKLDRLSGDVAFVAALIPERGPFIIAHARMTPILLCCISMPPWPRRSDGYSERTKAASATRKASETKLGNSSTSEKRATPVAHRRSRPTTIAPGAWCRFCERFESRDDYHWRDTRWLKERRYPHYAALVGMCRRWPSLVRGQRFEIVLLAGLIDGKTAARSYDRPILRTIFTSRSVSFSRKRSNSGPSRYETWLPAFTNLSITVGFCMKGRIASRRMRVTSPGVFFGANTLGRDGC